MILPLCVDMKSHYELLKYLYGLSYTPWNFHLHWVSLPLIYGVWHPYKHMITLLYRSFMPLISLVEKIHTDFKVGDWVPTKVKCIHMEKTTLALCLNASTYLPRVHAKIDALTLAIWNRPATNLEAKAR